MEVEDQALLLLGERPLLEVWPEVVGPPEAAALPAAGQAGVLLHSVPVALSVLPHVLHEDGVLSSRPWPLLQGLLCRRSTAAPIKRRGRGGETNIWLSKRRRIAEGNSGMGHHHEFNQINPMEQYPLGFRPSSHSSALTRLNGL
ncbi:hypothetical protein SAY87_012112 [Trapa incisa]|uniref:Uncharacterized protein n=1 Tax=Trapa incisa TaxID=236973 RepID=A0AAN7GMX9_9MYRT|nr:hypothetical protein SAY87_012112 [Trapa incisa]